MSGKAMAATIAALAFGCLLAIGVLFATGAQAQEVKCGPRADLVKMLKDKYQEVPVAIGQINDTTIMETYASVAGTWTMFLTNTDKVSCMVADGVAWGFDTKAFDDAKKGSSF